MKLHTHQAVFNTDAQGVPCPPLGIRFPPLFRVEVELWQQHVAALEAAGVTDIEAGSFAQIVFPNSQTMYPGIVKTEQITHLRATDDTSSVVVRWHPDRAQARAYLDACLDATDADEEDELIKSGLCETNDGVFTIMPRPTRSSWPGPLVFFRATVPADNVFGHDEWAYIVGPDGAVLDPKDFGLMGT